MRELVGDFGQYLLTLAAVVYGLGSLALTAGFIARRRRTAVRGSVWWDVLCVVTWPVVKVLAWGMRRNTRRG